MAWYPADAPVPSTLRTEEFLLRPLRASDVELDYDREWAFSRVAFLANRNQGRQLQLFADAGLRERYAVETEKEPRTFRIYGGEGREGVPPGEG